jgi:ABC-type Fe3+ transport system substrate-binding protein
VPQARIAPGPPPARLVIVTPHNETIRRVFEQGFSEWYSGEHGQSVNIRWIGRGTPQCLVYVEDAATNDEIALRGLVPDLMFGGGVTEHRVLAERGYAKALPTLPDEAAIPKSLQGVPLVDAGGNWHATALSAFGIIYHRQACSQRRIAEPKSWADLAGPGYYGWLALADPTRSGSNRFCLDLILQRHGWEKGWGLILRMAANARTLLPSSSEVIKNVSAGMCLAGLSVNFAAQQEVAAQRGDRLAFVSPVGASAITPDVSTVLNYASAPELAEKFLRFCLSERGQVLWSVRAGQGDQGQEGSDWEARPALFRYPVAPQMYEKYASKLAVADNPFTQASGFTVDMALEQKQAKVIGPLLLAACGENHILLQRAWKAVIDSDMPDAALAELTRPLFDEQKAYEFGARYESSDEAYGLAVDWAAAFRAKYEKVLQLTSSLPPAVPQ